MRLGWGRRLAGGGTCAARSAPFSATGPEESLPASCVTAALDAPSPASPAPCPCEGLPLSATSTVNRRLAGAPPPSPVYLAGPLSAQSQKSGAAAAAGCAGRSPVPRGVCDLFPGLAGGLRSVFGRSLDAIDAARCHALSPLRRPAAGRSPAPGGRGCESGLVLTEPSCGSAGLADLPMCVSSGILYAAAGGRGCGFDTNRRVTILVSSCSASAG